MTLGTENSPYRRKKGLLKLVKQRLVGNIIAVSKYKGRKKILFRRQPWQMVMNK